MATVYSTPEIAAMWAHVEAVETVLRAAGYVPEHDFGNRPGWAVCTHPETGGATVCAFLPDGSLEAYPGYKMALERAGYKVTRLPIYSPINGKHMHDLWHVARRKS